MSSRYRNYRTGFSQWALVSASPFSYSRWHTVRQSCRGEEGEKKRGDSVVLSARKKNVATIDVRSV